MENQINILHLEDNDNDALLVQLIIKNSGINSTYFQTDNKVDFIEKLNKNKIDIILSDYSLPDYSGNEALDYISNNFPHIPFVFVSGTMGEETAIESLLNGATDYVLKNKLEKLPSAINRAIKEAKLEKEYKEANEELIQSEKKYRTLINGMSEGLIMADNEEKILFANKQFCDLTAYNEKEIIGNKIYKLLLEEKFQILIEEKTKLRQKGIKDTYEVELIRKDSTRIWVKISASPWYDQSNKVIGSIAAFENIDESKKAQLELKKQQDLLQTIIDSTPDLIFYKDINSNYLGCNKAFEKYSNRSKEEQIGKSDYDFFDKETALFFRQKDQEIFKNKKSIKNEEWVIYPDGEKVLLETIKTPIYDENKHIIGLVGVSRNITERKITEINLKESEEKFKQIFENNPLGVIHFDKKGILTACNEILIEIMGSTRNKLIGLNLLKLKNEIVVKNIKNTLNNKKSYYEGEYYSLTGNKDLIIEAHFSPITNNENQNNGGIIIIEDITEKIKTEKTIFLQGKALDAAANAIVITDISGCIEWANPAFEKLTGYNLNEAIGKNPRDLLKSNHHDIGFFTNLWNTILRGKPWHGEILNRKKDGSLYYEEQIITPITNQENKITHFIAIKQDISERKKTEQDLLKAKEKAEASDKLKTAFMNNISHEIRTPLNGILGFTQMLCEPNLSSDEKSHYLDIIQASSDRLVNTVTDYIDIALISSANQDVRKNMFPVIDIINKLKFTNENKCKTKNLFLATSLPNDYENLILETDENLLFKVLNHILDNAIKFTHKGAINIGYKITNQQIEFFIKDTGIGINMSNISNLFNIFTQEDNSMTRGYEGSGLGLAIAKGFANLINANIRVESELGKGSTFWVSIPIEKINSKTISEKDFLNKEIIDKPLILIAEDDDDNYFLLETLFEKSEINFVRAYNGFEAINFVKQLTEISIILMDLKMPDLDGFEASKQIKEINKNIPIIAVTAFALSGDENKALDAGCDDYIEKPIRRSVFVEKLRKFGIIIK